MINSHEKLLLIGMQILQGRKWVQDQAVLIEGARIKAIFPAEMVEHHLPAKVYRYPIGHFLVPGFIDLHVHGAKGHDVMDGTEEALSVVANALAEEGVTGFLPTTLTAKTDEIENVLKNIASYPSTDKGAAILGAHLEGPFISSHKRGAQPSHVTLPDPSYIERWQEMTKGVIKIVTLAPELPGAFDLIKVLRRLGIVAAIGHTDATYEETLEAINLGCTQATHLFNAMRHIHQRDPGPAIAVLLSNEVAAEIIVDGIHLHPAIVELTYRIKRREQILLITDAMRAKCLKNGRYDLGGQTVEVAEGKATLSNGTLAGSTLTMPQAVKNMVDYAKCTLIDAIEMASLNPARVLGLELHKGTVEVDKDADLTILSDALKPVLTIRAGKVVFETSKITK